MDFSRKTALITVAAGAGAQGGGACPLRLVNWGGGGSDKRGARAVFCDRR
jgi:hypothetical protein